MKLIYACFNIQLMKIQHTIYKMKTNQVRMNIIPHLLYRLIFQVGERVS